MCNKKILKLEFRRFFVLIIACLNFPLIGYGQDSSKTNLEELSLEELLNIKVTVSSGKQDILSDAAGVVSIITSEEIRYSGARDMIDILRKVPGIDFGQDVENIIGVGMRGMWAQEGKVLLLIDGLEMHETIYSTLQFLQHYPIFNIKQIEIIRGPGSVIYGGNAELAVINIITKKGDDNKSITLNTQYGQLDGLTARKQASLSIGNSWKNGLSINIFGMINEGNLSNHYIEGNDSIMSINYKDSSKVSGNMLIGHFKFKQTELKYIFDEHSHDVSNSDFGYKHLSHIFNVKHTIKIKEKLSIIPQLFFKSQFPWNYTNASHDSIYNENYYTSRSEANLTAQYEANQVYSFLMGIRYLADHAEFYKSTSNIVFNYNGASKVDYNNFAVFTQANLKWKVFTLVPGLRFEKHNVYGAVIVPRINLTKKIGKWNLELQYNEAFRAPSILNIDLNSDIKPEKTYDKEIELSYRVNNNSIASLTLFHIDILNPIIYTSNSFIEQYENDQRTGSMGFETEYKYKSDQHNFSVNYSFYIPNQNKVDEFDVEGHSNILLAFPNHKAVVNYSIFLTKGLFINFNEIFYSSRYGYNAQDVLYAEGPVFLTGCFIGIRNLTQGLDLGIGVNDAFNEKYKFIQAYRSGNDALPGPGREFSIKCRYNLEFKK